MTTTQFIKKYNLKTKDVPRLYKIYLDLMAKKEVDQALKLSLVINKLDKNKLVNY